AGWGGAPDGARPARASDLSAPAALRCGLRALLCGSPADWARYDELFEAHWLGRFMRKAARIGSQAARRPMHRLPRFGAPDGPLGPPDGAAPEGLAEPSDGGGRRGGASAAESLETKD